MGGGYAESRCSESTGSTAVPLGRLLMRRTSMSVGATAGSSFSSNENSLWKLEGKQEEKARAVIGRLGAQYVKGGEPLDGSP